MSKYLDITLKSSFFFRWASSSNRVENDFFYQNLISSKWFRISYPVHELLSYVQLICIVLQIYGTIKSKCLQFRSIQMCRPNYLLSQWSHFNNPLGFLICLFMCSLNTFLLRKPSRQTLQYNPSASCIIMCRFNGARALNAFQHFVHLKTKILLNLSIWPNCEFLLPENIRVQMPRNVLFS